MLLADSRRVVNDAGRHCRPLGGGTSVTIREICDRLGRAFSAPAGSDVPDRGVCVACGRKVGAHEEIAFTGEHLRCYMKQLTPLVVDVTQQAAEARDRRRHPRYPATWSLRLWFGDLGFTNAHAANASTWGLGISLPTVTTATSLLKPGRTVGVEIFDTEGPVFRTTAAVRHRFGTALGVECADPVPAALLVGLEPSSVVTSSGR
jgi:hypothetical protein